MRKLWGLLAVLILVVGSTQIAGACSSFAVYGGPEPVLGMNWDLADDLELMFTIRSIGGTKVFQMQLEEYDNLLFYNEHGLLGNRQQSLPRTNLRSWRHQERVDLIEILTAAKSMKTVKEVTQYISDRRIMDRNNGSHSLYTDLTSAIIVEPGETQNHVIPMEESYALMTNFPIHFLYSAKQMEDFLTSERRYRAGTELIEANLDTFDLEDAFEVLEAITQTITRFSFAALPERNLVFLMLAGDFSRIWQVDLNEMTIETHRGFAQYRIEILDHHGITSTQLRTWK